MPGAILGPALANVGLDVEAEAMGVSAIWAGVAGAAVGAGFGFAGAVWQGVTTRREGRDGRKHDRDMRIWDNRAAAYVALLDCVAESMGRWLRSEWLVICSLITGDVSGSINSTSSLFLVVAHGPGSER